MPVVEIPLDVLAGDEDKAGSSFSTQDIEAFTEQLKGEIGDVDGGS